MSIHAPTARTVCISRVAASTARRLASGPRAVGRVHSVFASAVNVLGPDGRLLTLHGPGRLIAPFGAALERPVSEPRLEPGLAVERDGEHLVLGDLRVAWRGAEVVDCSIAAGTDPGPLAAALAVPPTPPGAPALASARALGAQERLVDGLRWEDAGRFAAGALGLIGLGEGLTPAGDDVLVGVLAVAWRYRPRFVRDRPDAGRAIARAARDGTTLIGREFLLAALRGEFSEAVCALAGAASAGAARGALGDLLAVGATSGADTAAGMRLALSALAPLGR